MEFGGTVALVAAVAVLMVAGLGVAGRLGWLFQERRQPAEEGPVDRSAFAPTFIGAGRNIVRGRRQKLEPVRIRELTQPERQYFVHSWTALQSSFIDDPRAAVASADQLTQQLMNRRGYPVRQVDAHGLDLSREHSKVLINYRIAHEIAMDLDTADLENLRDAIICFRRLFEALVQIEEPITEPVAQPGI